VLADYPGTILLVSHDRYLIDAIGTQIWEIEPGEASMRVFQGTYSQYRAQLESERATAEVERQPTFTAQKPASAKTSPEEKRRKARLKEVEVQIARLEARMAELARQLENPPGNPAVVQELGTGYVESHEELELLLKEWGELVEN
jgi:ATP-binding cassette subfamily F protein 3